MEKLNFMDLNKSVVGAPMEGLALVVSAVRRQTKTKKDYLQVTLSDSVQKTTSNVWDWTSENIPQPNDVVVIVGSVGEYMGNKQLNISSLKRSTEDSSIFAPQGNFNVEAYYKRAMILAQEIPDKDIRELTVSILRKESELWFTIPGALGVHHDYVAGTLKHSVDVTNNALSIYTNYAEIADLSLVIAGALLHDLGKLETYKLNGAVIEMTYEGQLEDHPVLGYTMLLSHAQYLGFKQYQLDKVRLLGHILLSHHGKLEYGAPVTPKCPEAMIVNVADGIDARMETYRVANSVATDGTWTERIYNLDNRPMLTSRHIASVMNQARG